MRNGDMRRKKILVPWIGHFDLRALAANRSPSRCDKLMSALGGILPAKSDWGPTRTLVSAQGFDEIHLRILL
jgi:hypothetical protein